jgi:hypothetical protein
MTAVGRSGLKANFALVYNSQNWRVVVNNIATVPRILGADTGFGFGWQLMLGSVMPVYTNNGALAYYLFTDSTGAQYHLTVNNSGIWTSTESVYVWYDSNQNRLYFRNGTFWAMGCVSSGGEQDAGTLYPTIVEDTNGNQIIITYMAGVGVSWNNSSSRIAIIEDARATSQYVWGDTVPTSYSLTYTYTTPPYLSGIQNFVGTGETYTVNVNQGQALNSPNTPKSNQLRNRGLPRQRDHAARLLLAVHLRKHRRRRPDGSAVSAGRVPKLELRPLRVPGRAGSVAGVQPLSDKQRQPVVGVRVFAHVAGQLQHHRAAHRGGAGRRHGRHRKILELR